MSSVVNESSIFRVVPSVVLMLYDLGAGLTFQYSRRDIGTLEISGGHPLVAGGHELSLSGAGTSFLQIQEAPQSWHVLRTLSVCFHQGWLGMYVKEHLLHVGPSLLCTCRIA